MTGRHLAALAALMLLPACALQGGDPSASKESDGAMSTISASVKPTAAVTPSAPAIKGAKKANSISIRVLPQIAHPGAGKANANKARTPVTVSVKPRRRTVVTLQVANGKKWKRVARAATDKRGSHVFHAAARRKGSAATYRVVVGKKASNSASTAAWLKPKFTDNFSGKKLSSTWSHRQTEARAGGRLCARGSAKATKVVGGTARLSVIRDKSRRKAKCRGVLGGKTTGKFAYRLNGHISTQNKVSFKYGFAAARLKFPKSQGQHGGFWLQPQVHVSGTVDPKLTGAEIDVVESFGAKAGTKGSMGLSSFTYHWRLVGNRGVQTKVGGYLKNVPSYLSGKGDAWHKRYHVFSVEWTPREYIFRIDGKETWRSKAGVSGQPQFAILSLLSSDYELHRLEGGDKNLPQHMHADWVRIWETS